MDGIDGLTALQVCTVAICVNFLSIFGYLNEEYQIFSLFYFLYIWLFINSTNLQLKFLWEMLVLFPQVILLDL